MKHDTAEIERALRVLHEPGAVLEVRTKKGPAGFFNDVTKAVRAVSSVRGVEAVWVTMNPIRDDLLERAPNRLRRAETDLLTKDRDVMARRWLLLDVDPERPDKDGPSTDDEHAIAVDRVRRIARGLQAEGWPAPIVADSGNGGHLLYRIDLPNDDEARAIVLGVLHALGERFDDERAKLDRKVFNASRITKLYGTLSAKGTSTRERPHRVSRLLEVPDRLEVVPLVSLKALLAAREPPPQPARPSTPLPRASSDVVDRARAWLSSVEGAVSGQGGHDATFRAASNLVNGFLLDENTAVSLLEEWNAACSPPWTRAELLHKVKTARKAGPDTAKGRTLGDLLNAQRPERGSTTAKPAPNAPTVESQADDADALWEQARADLIAAGIGVKDSGPRARRRFFTTTGRDLLDIVPPPTPWLVRGLLVAEGVHAIAAEPKNAKTWHTVEWAFAVASGTPAYGEFPAMRAPARVALFQAEDAKRSTKAKLRSLGAARGMSRAQIDEVTARIHVENLAELNLRNVDELADIVASCRALPAPIALLVLDPLRDLHSGDENKSDDMAEVAKALRALRTVLGCAVVFVHHSGKANENTGKRRGGQRMRGSSVLHGAVDGGLYLDAPTGNLSTEWTTNAHAEIKGARSAGAFTVTLRVLEDDEHGEALRVSWEVKTKARPDPIAAAAQLVARIAEALDPVEAVSSRDLERRLGLRNGDALPPLRDLEREGRAMQIPRKGWVAVRVPAHVPGSPPAALPFRVPASCPPVRQGGHGDTSESVASPGHVGTRGDTSTEEPWRASADELAEAMWGGS